MIYHGKTIVSYVETMGQYSRLLLEFPQDVQPLFLAAKAGQYILVKCEGHLLWRPFSINFVEGKRVYIFFQIKGAGTDWLSKRVIGDEVEIRGPLGQGFKVLLKEQAQLPILVAGGIGLAPLYYLREQLFSWRYNFERVALLIGAQKDCCLVSKEMLVSGATLATNDGSVGFCGTVIETLLEALKGEEGEGFSKIIYAAGPALMLREVARIAAEWKIPCQVLLEERIACGSGACYGCVIKTINGYKRVCCDGPVFNAEEVDWNEYTEFAC